MMSATYSQMVQKKIIVYVNINMYKKERKGWSKYRKMLTFEESEWRVYGNSLYYTFTLYINGTSDENHNPGWHLFSPEIPWAEDSGIPCLDFWPMHGNCEIINLCVCVCVCVFSWVKRCIRSIWNGRKCRLKRHYGEEITKIWCLTRCGQREKSWGWSWS